MRIANDTYEHTYSAFPASSALIGWHGSRSCNKNLEKRCTSNLRYVSKLSRKSAFVQNNFPASCILPSLGCYQWSHCRGFSPVAQISGLLRYLSKANDTCWMYRLVVTYDQYVIVLWIEQVIVFVIYQLGSPCLHSYTGSIVYLTFEWQLVIKVLIKTRATLCSRILCNDMIWPLGMILYSVNSIQDIWSWFGYFIILKKKISYTCTS